LKYETLKVAIASEEAVVTLNRPDVRNAFNPTMIRELTECFAAIASRSDIAVVVLKGEGAGFCSGADLGYMKSMAGFSFAENEKDAEVLFEMFASLRHLPQVLIAQLHGAVMGGGLGLAAVADIAAAEEKTQFCFSEVKLGLAPAVISPFVLERMNQGVARRLMLTGEIFNALTARESELVHFIGSTELVGEFITQQSQAIRRNGHEAVRATKALLRLIGGRADQSSHWSVIKKLTARAISERRVSAEGQEGLTAFLEKREPTWRKNQDPK
jgi:methylglutaconyl-CoA hydratase